LDKFHRKASVLYSER